MYIEFYLKQTFHHHEIGNHKEVQEIFPYRLLNNCDQKHERLLF